MQKGIIFLILLCSYFLADAQIELRNNEESYLIGKSISYLRDTSGLLSLDNILSQNSKFLPSAQEQLNFGYVKGALWVKVSLENQSDFNDWILNLDIDNINYIDFYQKKEDVWTKQQTGNYLPFSTKEIKRTGFAFSLNIPQGTQKTYYLRIKTQTSLILPLYIQRNEVFNTHILLKTLYYGIFFGILLVMFVYNFFIYLTLKDQSYLFYIFTLIATLGTFSTLSGYNFMLLWQNMPMLNAFTPHFAIASLVITTAVFNIHFLQLKKNAPKLHSIMVLNIILIIASVLLNLFVSLLSLNNFIGIYHVIMLIISGFIIWKKGNPLGKYYVFAWIFYVLGSILTILRNNGTIPSNFFTAHAVELGAILEVVIIAFALSEKYRLMKQEKELTHQKYLQVQKEANQELEGKVNERTAELQATLDMMSGLYIDIEKKNDNINSSINYASRIQEAFLAVDYQVQKKLPEHFIFLKPRDVVSGDFYLFAEKDDKIIIAAVDCTGHGVPGAMMSMIGQSFLNQIIYSLGILEVNKILSELHYKIRMALLQDSDEHTVKDGMDMAICMIDQNTKTLEFAGAKRPLIYIQDNELHYIKGSGLSIGGRVLNKQEPRSYEQHNISIKSETSVYLFTDGFQDQFGGENDTKFMIKNLKKILFENHTKPLEVQKQSLENTFSKWKGDSRQIDDVLIVGFKLD